MLEKYYQPSLVEDKIYKTWENDGDFKPLKSSSDAYCIVIPPPNVTGTLHMGHAPVSYTHLTLPTICSV